MMPVLPSPKRSNGFSIDSLVSKDCGARPQGGQPQCGCPGTQDSLVLRTGVGIPPCSAALQTLHGAPHPAFLSSAAAAAAAASYPEGLHPSFEASHHGFPTGAGPLPGGPLPPGFPCLPGGPPGMPGILPPHLLGLPQKESFPFYTWLLARHGNYLSHRLTGAEAAYLFPFRKPKRIRTAFSPSQLLQLEHAFEKNHYVVGQERKDLAHSLNLTETQVKVWFQNRRTKHKRTAQEENEQRRKTDRAESESEFVDVESPPDSPPESPLSPGMEGDCDADSDCPASPTGMPPSMTSHHMFRPNPTTSCTSSSSSPSSASSTSSSDVITRRCDSHSTLPPHTNVYTSDSHLLHNKVV